MSEGMLQLLFFAFIFIALPAIEGVLRGRKNRGGGMNRGPVEDMEVDWEPDGGSAEDRPRRETGTAVADQEPPGGRERSSEGLLPADLWEELAALARGERRPDRFPPTDDDEPGTSERHTPGPVRAERTEPRAPATPVPDATMARAPEERSPRSRTPRPIPPKHVPRAAPHAARTAEPRGRELPGRGAVHRRPSPAAPESFPEAEGSPIEAGAIGSTGAGEHRAGAAAEVLGVLRQMSNDDLQRAVIFREVLGPPISERRGSPGDPA